MIYVDDAHILWRGKPRCHLTADTLQELHHFAARVGVKRCWFHRGRTPHYDITENERAIAIRLGATEETTRQAAVRRRARSQTGA